MMMMGSGGPDTTALLVQRLQQLEADERRAVQRSRWMMLVACLLGEAALILSLGAALWSKQYNVFPASISDLNADNDNPNAKIFFGLLVAMGITLLASKYGQRILRLHTVPEMVYFDVIIPIAIIVTACVPEIMPPDEDGGGGAWIMTAVHSGAAAIVCVVSPIIITTKSIPRPPPPSDGTRSMGCATSLCQPNPVLASYGDVLLRCGGRPLLRYHWGQMVVIQTLCVGLFVIFFAYNELYAPDPLLHEHVISFSTEFTLVTLLFFSFLIITRLGLEEGSAAHGTGARAGSMGRGSGDRVAVTVRESNGGGSSAGTRDEEAAQQGGGGGPQAEGMQNGNGQQQQPSPNGNGFADWVRQFTNRVSIGE